MATANTTSIEPFMTAEEYNKLPHIDDMRDATGENAGALQSLLHLIRSYDLRDKFSVHLLHKHFDAPEGSIMVYETKTAASHPTFMMFTPRNLDKGPKVRGLYFQARPGGSIRPYEFAQDSGENISAHGGFIRAFSDMCFEFNVQDVFALTARGPMDTIYNEIEWPEFGSTLLIPESLWTPSESDGSTTVTDWSPPADPSVPGIIELKCTKTRSQKHYNVTCSKTRSGKHYQKPKPKPSAGVSSYQAFYEFDGKQIGTGTDMFKVFDAAHAAIVEVC